MSEGAGTASSSAREERLAALGAALAAELEHSPGREAALAYARTRLLEGSAARGRAGSATRRSRLTFWIPAGAAALGAALLLWPAGEPTMRVAGEAVSRAVVPGTVFVAPMGNALDLELSQGAALTLAPGAGARLERMARDGAELRVERGTLRVAVTRSRPWRQRLWHFDAGPFTVRVTGTRFALGWDPAGEVATVHMDEGSVVVSASCLSESRVLRAGDVFRHSCRRSPSVTPLPVAPGGAAHEAAAAAPAVPVSPPAPPPPRAEPRRASERRPPPTEAPAAPSAQAVEGWRAHFQAGRYAEAYAVASRAGFARELARGTASDLLALGDTARLAHAPERAFEAYRSLRRRFARGSAAAQAAYALGRLHGDERGEHLEAAGWFATYLKEAPRGPLAAEAAGRQLDALRRAGRTDEARRLAARYLAQHPDGPYRDLARSLAAP
jgi:hypothetical protein